MGESCAIAVYVKGTDGQITVSKLFKDLLEVCDSRSDAKKYYNVFIGEEFKKYAIEKGVKVDEQTGELDFDSLFANGFRELLNQQYYKEKIAKDNGFRNRDGSTIYVNQDASSETLQMMQRVLDFNKKASTSDASRGVYAVMVPDKKGRLYVNLYDFHEENDRGSIYLPTYNKKLEFYVNNINLLKSRLDNLGGGAAYDFAMDLFNNIVSIKSLTQPGNSYTDLESFDPTSTLEAIYLAFNFLIGENDESSRRGIPEITDRISHWDDLSQSNKTNLLEMIAKSAVKMINNGAGDLRKRLCGILQQDENDYLFDGNIFTNDDKARLNSENQDEVSKFMDKAVPVMVNLWFGIYPDASPKHDWTSSVSDFMKAMNNNMGLKAKSAMKEFGFYDKEKAARLVDLTKTNMTYFADVEGIDAYSDKDYQTIDELSRRIQKDRKEASDNIEQLDTYQKELEALYKEILNAEYRRRGILREKKGMSTPQINLIEEDYKRIDEVIHALNSAKGAATISSAIYNYVDDIGLRVMEFQNMILEMNQGSYTVQQRASMLRDLKEFIDVYNKISSGIRRLILDGGNYVEEVKGVAIENLSDPTKDWNSYSELRLGEMPKELLEYRENMQKWSDADKIDNIDYIGEMAYATYKWNLDHLDGYTDVREDEDKYNEMLSETKATIMGYVDAVKAAKSGSLREKQEAMAASLDKYNRIINNLESDYKNSVKPLIIKFLDAYMQDEQRKVKFGTYMGFKAGEEITVEKLLTSIKEDINVYQRLFSSMTDSPDMITNLMGESIKRQKFEAQQDHMLDVEEITREAMLLRQAGITDTKWMFEHDVHGNRTGYYVRSKKESSIFDRMMKNENVRMKFGLKDGETYLYSRHTAEENEAFEALKNKWIENAEKNKTIDVEESAEYLEIMNNPAKKRFYEFFMKKYEQLQNFYPERVIVKDRIIGLRANEKEEFAEADGMMDRIKRQYNHFLDQFQTQYNDDVAMMKVDPSGREIKMLPIYFCNFKPEDIPTVTQDCVSALMAYSAKAHEYNKLNDVVDSLELTKELLKERNIERKKAGLNVVENYKRYKKQKEKGEEVDFLSTPDEGKSNISQMLDDIFDMQLYGRYHKPEGVVNVFGKKIDLGKTADMLNKRTAESALSLSLTNGLSNIATGTVMMATERAAQQFFKKEDIRWANKTYFSNAPEVALEVAGKTRVKKNKLVLLGDLFDVQDEYVGDTSDMNWDRNTFGRMYGSLCQFMQNAGEHWMAYKTFLAVMHTYNVKDKDGNVINLYEAFEVKHYNDKGELTDEDKDLGGRAVLKEGVTTMDGKVIDKDELRKIIYEVHARTLGINHDIHGIYNEQDANAIQKYALGRMAYMFRKWIPAAIHRRFGKVQYNMDKRVWTEGYYRTCGRFMFELYKEWIRGNKTLSECWHSLTPEEIANVKRGMLEVAMFILVQCIASLGVGKWGDDDEEEKNSFVWREFKYQIWRLKSEIGALVPWPPTMIGEIIRIFKSPMACINTSEYILSIFDLLKVWNFAEEQKTGVWKGCNKWLADFLNNRAIFPKLNVIMRNTRGLEEASRQYMN